MFVNLKGEPHIITPDAGTHVFSRIYFYDGEFRCGDRTNNQIGCERVVRADYSPATGLTLTTTRYVAHVPPDRCQANWSK